MLIWFVPYYWPAFVWARLQTETRAQVQLRQNVNPGNHRSEEQCPMVGKKPFLLELRILKSSESKYFILTLLFRQRQHFCFWEKEKISALITHLLLNWKEPMFVTFLELFHLIHMLMQWGRYCYPHFTGEEIEAQKSEITQPGHLEIKLICLGCTTSLGRVVTNPGGTDSKIYILSMTPGCGKMCIWVLFLLTSSL